MEFWAHAEAIGLVPLDVNHNVESGKDDIGRKFQELAQLSDSFVREAAGLLDELHREIYAPKVRKRQWFTDAPRE